MVFTIKYVFFQQMFPCSSFRIELEDMQESSASVVIACPFFPIKC